MQQYLYDNRSTYAINYIEIVVLIAILLAVLIYILFLSKKNESRFTGVTKWLYDFFSFKKLLIEPILKFLYLIVACFMTIGGFVMLFQSFGYGFFLITIGNVIVRLTYEFTLMFIFIFKNTSAINKKLRSSTETSATLDEQDGRNEGTSFNHEVYFSYYCTHCGKAYKKGDDYCSNCGNKIV